MRIIRKKIEPFIGKEPKKILTCQRPIGKSYLMYQIMDAVKKPDPKANFYYINKELNEFEQIITFQQLYDYVKHKTTKKTNNYLFM